MPLGMWNEGWLRAWRFRVTRRPGTSTLGATQLPRPAGAGAERRCAVLRIRPWTSTRSRPCTSRVGPPGAAAAPAAPERARGRRARRALPARRDASVGGPLGGARPGPRRAAVAVGGAGTVRRHRRQRALDARARPVRARLVPGSRLPGPLGDGGGGGVHGRRRGGPCRVDRPQRPRAGRDRTTGRRQTSRRERLRRLLHRVRRRQLRRSGVDEQRLGRGAVHRVRRHRRGSGLRPVPERRERRHHRWDHGGQRPPRGLLRLHPPPRPARADRCLRGRRSWSTPVLGLGRPRPVAARPGDGPGGPVDGHGRPGARRRPARVQRGRGLRDALGLAHPRAPGRRRVRLAGVPRLRRRARPPGRRRRRDRRPARRPLAGDELPVAR